ncbi:hypothetical protein P4T60_07120 [Bacillus atrophaeus]|nr:hypothetical protein [Bacillus atrophaeus]
MMKTYLMLTAKTDCFGTGHVPGHYGCLDRLQAENRLNMFGLFSDATGGLYVIEVNSLEEASENRSFGTAC